MDTHKAKQMNLLFFCFVSSSFSMLMVAKLVTGHSMISPFLIRVSSLVFCLLLSDDRQKYSKMCFQSIVTDRKNSFVSGNGMLRRVQKLKQVQTLLSSAMPSIQLNKNDQRNSTEKHRNKCAVGIRRRAKANSARYYESAAVVAAVAHMSIQLSDLCRPFAMNTLEN